LARLSASCSRRWASRRRPRRRPGRCSRPFPLNEWPPARRRVRWSRSRDAAQASRPRRLRARSSARLQAAARIERLVSGADEANVEVVADRIARITPRGIVTIDGRERACDVIIYGTGFAATEFLAPIRSRHHGQRLSQPVPAVWPEHEPRPQFDRLHAREPVSLRARSARSARPRCRALAGRARGRTARLQRGTRESAAWQRLGPRLHELVQDRGWPQHGLRA
jgi:cation diffusion facilitator CzcD-associated flavoprotein CzcO